jgi:intracellular septation protein A
MIQCELIDKGDPNQMVQLCRDVWQRSNYVNCVFFIDGSNRAMVNLLKIRWQESLSWDQIKDFGHNSIIRIRPVNLAQSIKTC